MTDFGKITNKLQLEDADALRTWGSSRRSSTDQAGSVSKIIILI